MKNSGVDLSPLRETGADFVTDTLYAMYAVELQRFGERGKQNCRKDILFHFDYLQSALNVGDPNVFVRYTLWLKDILNSRSVPVAHLSTSFEMLISFLNSKLTPEAAASATAIIDAARAALLLDVLPALYTYSLRVPHLHSINQYRESLLQGDHRSALQLVGSAMQNGSSLTEVSVRLVQPALYQIGNLWQKNEINVAREHMATEICRNVLASAYLQATFAPPIGKTAMFACIEGNHHALGLRMLADAFETKGWQVFYLGANLPCRDLMREVDAKRPQLLALSASMPQHIATASTTIESLRAEMGSACPEIWMGGLATLLEQSIWKITKADSWAADALHAMEQL